jgi:HD-like signal output (HDOD) protein
MNFPEYELKIGEDKYGLCSVLKDAEDEKFGISHSRIGHMLCHYWGIPEVVCEAIRDHDKVDAYELPSTSEKLAYMSIGHLGHIRYMKKKGIYNQELDHIFRAIKQVYELDETTVNEIFDIELQA